MLQKVEIGKQYEFGGWEVLVIRIDEKSSPEFIEEQRLAKKPKPIWLFRRVWYSKIGDSGAPFYLNEELFLMLAKEKSEKSA